METLNHFSVATGLIVNMDKSSIFLAGVDDTTKEQLLQRTGFALGDLPMKYLGLPLSSKKWNKMDCHLLVEKITQRVKVTYSRQLSDAGRLHVVSAVLFFIHRFWSTVFILPQSILKEVDTYVGYTYKEDQLIRKGWLCYRGKGTVTQRKWEV